MRILSVGNMYPPHHMGGYELVWRSAVGELRRRGHDVRVLTTDFRLPGIVAEDDPNVHRELRWYWHEHVWPRRTVRERLALERHNERTFDRHVDEQAPDVISWWSMGGLSLSLLARAKRTALPAVAFVHDDWLIYGPEVDQWLRIFGHRGWLRPLARVLTSRPTSLASDGVHRWVFVSETIRRRALEAGWRGGVSEVAPSGIDPSFLGMVAPEQGWGWRLLYVGRIDRRKGIDTAVEALSELPQQSTLTVVGEGDAGALRVVDEQIGRLGLSGRVRLLGARDRNELPALYAAADALVFPVDWEEPWGLVPLEAMAIGRPVIATGRGGSGEYLRHRENCLLFPSRDASGLASAVRTLADDPALRRRLREAGLALAPLHTETVFNERVVAAVEHAAGVPGRRR